MKIKINYNELDELSKYIISKSDEINSLYDDLSITIDNLSNIWMGNDSKEFIEVAQNDIKNEKKKNNKLRKYGEDLGNVSKDFKNKEEAWLEALKRENMTDE